MGQFSDCEGNMIEIESLVVNDEEEYVKVDTLEDFDKLTKAMGWDDGTVGFVKSTGVPAEELLGKFWFQQRDRVFILEGNIT